MLAITALIGIALALYLPYATEAGWFYDDWQSYSLLKDEGGTVLDGMSACMEKVPGGRKLACVYHAAEWSALGDHRWAYHLVSIAFLVAIASLTYAIARRCGLARGWSFLVAAAVIVFPGGDSTRLWAVASIGQYVVALQMTGLLLALVALGRPPGPRATALHVGGGMLALLAMATYEIAVPLVAVQGLVYLAAYRNRAAALRWAADVGLVLAFSVYRLVIAPVPESTDFVVQRTAGQLVERVPVLLEGAWTTWRSLYAPGMLLFALAAVVVTAALWGARDRALRSRMTPWWALLAAATTGACACALVFLTAHDLYVPTTSSTFNRLNLPGTIPYAAAFVALLGLLYELVRRLSPWALLAPLVVAIAALGVGKHQIGVGATHQDAWLESWHAQQRATPGIRQAMRGVPTRPRVFGFDTPLWERGWVPVFAAIWDLRGMIDYMTDVDPVYASPFGPDVTCGRKGVQKAEVMVAPYRGSSAPVYFVSPSRRLAVEVRSSRDCERWLAAWGRPPFWGRSITG